MAKSLTSFLLERIDEDEHVARDVGPTRAWRDDLDTAAVTTADARRLWQIHIGEPGTALMAHLVQHQPGRVLAECDAKRRIVALHHSEHPSSDGAHECPELELTGGTYTGLEIDCLTLRLLAAPYSDHPDYDPSWRPEAD